MGKFLFYPEKGISQTKKIPYFYGKFLILKALAKCKIGELVTVSSILSSDINTKLLEMGIYEKKELNIIYKAPFGDPIAVQVGDYILSMRLAEANLILVNS